MRKNHLRLLMAAGSMLAAGADCPVRHPRRNRRAEQQQRHGHRAFPVHVHLGHGDQGYAAQRHLPAGSQMVIVPDAGHFPHLERPDEVNPLILRWVAR
jgi:pimeloyl-ACP methyl ester carboxylesterase